MRLTVSTTADLIDGDDVPVEVGVILTRGVPPTGLGGDPDQYDPGTADMVHILCLWRTDTGMLVSKEALRPESRPRFEEDVCRLAGEQL